MCVAVRLNLKRVAMHVNVFVTSFNKTDRTHTKVMHRSRFMCFFRIRHFVDIYLFYNPSVVLNSPMADRSRAIKNVKNPLSNYLSI